MKFAFNEHYTLGKNDYYGQYEALVGPRNATRTNTLKREIKPDDHIQQRGTCNTCHQEIILFTRRDASNPNQVDPSRYSYFRTVCACNAHMVGKIHTPTQR